MSWCLTNEHSQMVHTNNCRFLKRSLFPSSYSAKKGILAAALIIATILILVPYDGATQETVLSPVTSAVTVPLTDNERAWIAAHRKLRVHNEKDWPPLNFAEDKIPKGFSIDYMNLLARKLGIEIEYVTGPTWNEFLEMARKKEIDVLTNTVRTKDRQEYLEFTQPYVANTAVYAIRKDSKPIKRLEDLFGKTVAIPRGFFHQEILEKKYPQIQLLLVNNQTEALKAVSDSAADATIGGVAIQQYLLKKLRSSNLKLGGTVSDEIFSNKLRIAVRKDWPQLGTILQKTMDTVSKDDVSKLQDKWFGGVISDTPQIELSPAERKWLKDNPGPLVVANEMDWPPFDFAENGEPKGFAIDLMRLIAAKAGMNIKFVNGLSWAELMAKFKVGEIDIMPAIYKNDERLAFISFTSDYFSQPSVMVVHKNNNDIRGLADLPGRKVAAIKGFALTTALKTHYPDIELVLVNQVVDAVKAVSIGQVDAFIDSIGTLSYVMEKNYIPNIKFAGNVEPKGIENPSLHIGVARERTVLRDILDKGLQAITPEEKVALTDRWLGLTKRLAPEATPEGAISEDKNLIWWLVIIGGVLLIFLVFLGRLVDRSAVDKDAASRSVFGQLFFVAAFLNLKIGAKILIVLVTVSSSSIAILGIMDYRTTKQTLREESFNKLTAVREMKAQQIEDYFTNLIRQVRILSTNASTIEAAERFSEGFRLNDNVFSTDDQKKAAVARVRKFYRDQFHVKHKKVADTKGGTDFVDRLLPQSVAGLFLQDLFIARNKNPLGQKNKKVRVEDRNASERASRYYNDAHADFQPFFDRYIQTFGFYDAFIVDSKGNIVYSVFKEIDYATSLIDGPHAKSNIADLFRKVMKANERDYVAIVDFQPYLPSYDAPAAFVGSSIYKGSEKIGVLIFQMPIDRINDVMTSRHSWKDVGLGDSGETYIVGDDFLMRNQSRFLIEDRERYLEMIRHIGVPDKTVAKIAKYNSSVGLQRVETKGTKSALSGGKDTDIFPDYRGVSVLSSYRPLRIPNVQWVLMSEIDEAEAMAAVEYLKFRIFILIAGFLTAILLIAFFFSKSITQPLKVLTAKAGALAQGELDEPIEIEGRDEIAALAKNFDDMRVTLRDMIHELEQRVEERTANLAEKEAQLRLAFDNMPAGIKFIDKDLQVLAFNPQYLKVMGFPRDLVREGKSSLVELKYQAERGDFGPGNPDKLVEKTLKTHGSRKSVFFERELPDGRFVNITIQTTQEGERVTVVRDITDHKRAEEEILKSRNDLERQTNTLHTVLESMDHGLVAFDQDLKLQVWNSHYLKMRDYPEELAEEGRPFRDFMQFDIDRNEFGPGDPAQQMAEKLDIAGRFEPFHFERTRPDGTIIEVLGSPITGGGFVNTITDITERKKAEQTLKNSEERVRTIIETAADGIIVIGEDGVIQSFSPAAERIFGYMQDEVIGKKINLLMPEPMQSEHDDYLKRYFETGEKRVVGITRELIGLRKDTTKFPMELAVGEGSLGNQSIFTGLIRDITERKKAEQAIEEAAEKLQVALSSMSDGIYILDSDQNFVAFNQRYLDLLDFPESVVREGGSIAVTIEFAAKRGDYGNQFDGDIDDIVAARLKQFKSNKETLNENTTPKGRIVEYRGSPIKGGGFVTIMHDVTEQRKAERELSEAMDAADAANQAKSAFLANMSHELRTPMNAILGYAEMLAEDAEDENNDERFADIQEIIESGEHLLSLVNDVLDISKVESGRMELYLETFEIEKLIKDVASTSKTLTDKGSNKLIIDLPEEPGKMHADLTKIRQILFNLISNAAKFTSKGSVTLAVERQKADNMERILISVTDTGIGIPEDKLDHIFEEFAQADDSTTRDYGGTGLGLTLVERFCEMMGGRIWVESTIGKGSTFFVDLPSVVTEEDEKEDITPADEKDVAISKPAADTQESLGKSILIIDDDTSARNLLKRNLEAAGHDVILAKNGKEGLSLARKHKPALITLDVVMPGQDGWAVLQQLKGDVALQDIPVIMISMIDNKTMGRALGAVDHMSKPVNRKKLKELVNRYIQKGTALVVEDDPAAREVVVRAFKSEGWTAVEAVNGKEGLERFGETEFDLIILDIMMPVMDGFKFIKELRATDKGRNVPVVVLTAKDLTKKERTKLKGNVQEIFLKEETSVEELLAEIDAQLTIREV
jgi:PAS domain S-box-containing protein